jgi:arsenate reductase-like glutaredoxin family protein
MKQFTKKELKEMIKILKHTKELIDNEQEEFICLALEFDCKEYPWHLRFYIMGWVQDMLNYSVCSCLERWLVVNHKIETSFDNYYKRKITRVKWINWMIKQLKLEIKGMQYEKFN